MSLIKLTLIPTKNNHIQKYINAIFYSNSLDKSDTLSLSQG